MIIHSRTEDQTATAGREFAGSLQAGDIILLEGTLGAGKSVFARALIRELAGNAALEVPSPTFTLVQTYETSKGPLWHFDLYRLKEPEEIYELGWEDALGDAIMVVEWPTRLGALKPPTYIDIRIDIDENGPDSRTIHINRT